MKVAFVGGTSGMGRALSRLMAGRGDTVCLLGHLPEDLERSVSDLEARGAPGGVSSAPCDLRDVDTLEPALDQAEQQMGGLDALIITAGMFGTQEKLEEDAKLRRAMYLVNYANTVELCELAKPRLLKSKGTICVFSSVAGDRGRKPVILYGSTKAGVSHYLESMDHRYHADGLHVMCVKPGFVKTGMTAGLKPPPFAGEPEGVARQVLKAIDKRKALVYTPSMWRLVMMVIKSLPRFVMRKIGF